MEAFVASTGMAWKRTFELSPWGEERNRASYAKRSRVPRAAESRSYTGKKRKTARTHEPEADSQEVVNTNLQQQAPKAMTRDRGNMNHASDLNGRDPLLRR